MSAERCERCDLPRATADDWMRYVGGEGEHLCWADVASPCAGPRVDWRARALAAEAERDEARRLLAAAGCGELPRCECWCGCARLGMRESGSGESAHLCDVCLAEHERVAGERADRGDWRDISHAAMVRAAMERR